MDLKSHELPEGLQETLQEFIKAYTRERPTDYIAFAARYFADLATAHRPASTSPRPVLSASTGPLKSSTGQLLGVDEREKEAKEETSSQTSVDSEPPEENSHLLERRKTVYAEAYDPESDPNLNEREVHPKSEEQRAWLLRTLQTVFFFRQLEPECIQEIIDAFQFRDFVEGEKVCPQMPLPHFPLPSSHWLLLPPFCSLYREFIVLHLLLYSPHFPLPSSHWLLLPPSCSLYYLSGVHRFASPTPHTSPYPSTEFPLVTAPSFLFFFLFIGGVLFCISYLLVYL